MYRLLLITFILTASLTFSSQMVMAQNKATTPQDCCWIDTKTGKQVPTVPLSGVNMGSAVTINGAGAAKYDDSDPKNIRAFNPKTGQNFYRDPDGCWFDSKTGKQVRTVPLSGVNMGTAVTIDGAGAAKYDDLDPKNIRAFNPKTGQIFVLVPCPLPAETAIKDTVTKKDKNKTIGSTNFQRNELFVGFSLIREDNGSSGFNTYGGQLAYTRNLCWRGGLTGDVGINLGNNGGINYTKFSVLAGGTYYPIKTAVPASDFSFSIHALGGLSTIRSSYSGNSNSNSFFTLDVGVGFNYYISHKLGLGLRAGYMPAFNKGNTSNNMRIALGLDFR